MRHVFESTKVSWKTRGRRWHRPLSVGGLCLDPHRDRTSWGRSAPSGTSETTVIAYA